VSDLLLTDACAASAAVAVSPECQRIRRANFPDQITFHAPGLRRYRTSEYSGQKAGEFIAISVTGSACALKCAHCNTNLLKSMLDLARFNDSVFDLCAALAERGVRGLLISGGSDRWGRVPLRKYIPDLIRVRRELGMTIRVHPGLPDEETCAGLAAIDIDGAMVDIIGHQETIRAVYHLDATPAEYEAALERLERYGVPTVPHIILGLHFGRMLGEWKALEIIARHPPKLLVLVVLTPLTGTPMAVSQPPSLAEIGGFFEQARKTLPTTPVMLGCARPMGLMKVAIDRLAIDAGLNGIAYPAEGVVEHARLRGLEPTFVNACCGVTW